MAQPPRTPETPATIPFKALQFQPRPVAPEDPTEAAWEELAVQDGIYNAIRKYGARRVMAWVRNLAAIAGQEVS